MLVPKPPAPSLPSSARLAGGGRWDPGAIRTPAPPPMLVQQQMAEPQPMPQPAAEQLPPLLLLGDELLGLLLSSPAAGGAAGLLATRDLLSLRGACWSLRDRGQVEVAADLLAGRLAVEFSSAAAVRPRRRPAAVARLLCTCIWIVREKEREREESKGVNAVGRGVAGTPTASEHHRHHRARVKSTLTPLQHTRSAPASRAGAPAGGVRHTAAVAAGASEVQLPDGAGGPSRAAGAAAAPREAARQEQAVADGPTPGGGQRSGGGGSSRAHAGAVAARLVLARHAGSGADAAGWARPSRLHGGGGAAVLLRGLGWLPGCTGGVLVAGWSTHIFSLTIIRAGQRVV